MPYQAQLKGDAKTGTVVLESETNKQHMVKQDNRNQEEELQDFGHDIPETHEHKILSKPLFHNYRNQEYKLTTLLVSDTASLMV